MPTENASNNNKTQGLAVPDELPSDIAKLIEQALHISQVEKGFQWVLENMGEEKDPRSLLETYLERYEEQILQLRGDLLQENHLATYRSATLARYLSQLPRYRMHLANKAYNHVFIETWLKERLLASILGVTVRDVKLRTHDSNQKPPVFLSDELNHALPKTFLKDMTL